MSPTTGNGGVNPCPTISATILADAIYRGGEKIMKKTCKTLMGAGMLMIALAVNGLAQGEFKGLGDGVETCPVTGEKIINKDVKDEFYGRTVNFCCAG